MFRAVRLNHEKLRELREKRGWTMAQAADAAGMKSRQAWYNYESGYATNLTIERLNAIAAALKVSSMSLLVFEE